MMTFVEKCDAIFEASIQTYHQTDNVDESIRNPYPEKSIEYYLYLKNWIDTVQWHLEDIIRDPNIRPEAALQLKRRIDKSNQDRTDLVELIDSYFWEQYHSVNPLPDAKINTESPRKQSGPIRMRNISGNVRRNCMSCWNSGRI